MIRVALIAVAVLAVTGCEAPVDPIGDKISRSGLVKVCRDGTWIGRDPTDGRLVAVKEVGALSARRSILPAGVDANTVCGD